MRRPTNRAMFPVYHRPAGILRASGYDAGRRLSAKEWKWKSAFGDCHGEDLAICGLSHSPAVGGQWPGRSERWRALDLNARVRQRRHCPPLGELCGSALHEHRHRPRRDGERSGRCCRRPDVLTTGSPPSACTGCSANRRPAVPGTVCVVAFGLALNTTTRPFSRGSRSRPRVSSIAHDDHARRLVGPAVGERHLLLHELRACRGGTAACCAGSASSSSAWSLAVGDVAPAPASAPGRRAAAACRSHLASLSGLRRQPAAEPLVCSEPSRAR